MLSDARAEAQSKFATKASKRAPLTVVSVAYPLAPIADDAVGGAEQVLLQLHRALSRAGHRSIVIANDQSTLNGELVSFPDSSPSFDGALRLAESRARAALQAVLERESVDLIHLHAVNFAGLLPSSHAPVLVTLHLPRAFYFDKDLYAAPDHVWMNCVSAAQRTSFGAVPAILGTIENGVRIEKEMPIPMAERHRALWLGRICPEKALHTAMEAALHAGVGLTIAGRTFPYPEHLEYFRSSILPRLGPLCSFIGPVGGERKRTLLRHARCVVVASEVEETSSLVAREALAAGTPVVARNTPALAELIEEGVSGFLVNDSAQMAQAIEDCVALDPHACVRTAQRKCSETAMIARYFGMYEQLRARVATSVARSKR